MISRRAALAALATAALGCRRSGASATRDDGAPTAPTASGPPPAPAPAPIAATSARLVELPRRSLGSWPAVEPRVVILTPTWAPSAGDAFPLLVALHGRGESLKGPVGGAWGWVRDYELPRAIERLRAPPLTREDFRGFVDAARLARLNASLAERPFRGLVVACPWVPDVLDADHRADLDAAATFGAFVEEDLVPRVRREAGVRADAAVGIDGVSLGGRVALTVGLARPAAFRAVGSLQAAIQPGEAPELARRAAAALAGPAAPRLRLLTSDGDYFRGAIGALHDALAARRVAHEHLVVPGPHDYPFNRGPGAIEMLLFHDRALRGEPTP